MGTAQRFLLNLLALAALLVLPVLAGLRLTGGYRSFAAYAIAINSVTYLVYAWDKQRACAGEWRVPEGWLHLLELLGGWPGALIAQRRLRHKCSKRSYQFVFWAIVIAHQFAAVDSFQQWQLSRSVLDFLQTVLKS